MYENMNNMLHNAAKIPSVTSNMKHQHTHTGSPESIMCNARRPHRTDPEHCWLVVSVSSECVTVVQNS